MLGHPVRLRFGPLSCPHGVLHFFWIKLFPVQWTLQPKSFQAGFMYKRAARKILEGPLVRCATRLRPFRPLLLWGSILASNNIKDSAPPDFPQTL